MGSETPLLLHPEIPIIDFSMPNLKPGTPEWESVRAQVWKAAQEYGSFVASYNKIPLEFHKAVLKELEDLFDLPLDAKMRNVPDPGNPYGSYIGQIPTAPLYESMGIHDATNLEKVQSITGAFWPQGNPSFSKTIHLFSKEVAELEKIMRRMIAESLGVGKYVDGQTDAIKYLMRFQKYKAPQTNESQIGLFEHKDKNLITLLCENGNNGLEVKTKDDDGGQWILAKPSLGSFIVVFGESLCAWANGRLYPAPHRVMMVRGKEERYSVAFGSGFGKGYIVEAPKELVDEEHPLLYKPFDYFEYMNFTAEQARKLSDPSVKAYCGI